MKKMIIDYVCEMCGLEYNENEMYSRGMKFDVLGVGCKNGVRVEVGENKSSFGVRVYSGKDKLNIECMKFSIRKDDEDLERWRKKRQEKLKKFWKSGIFY